MTTTAIDTFKKISLVIAKRTPQKQARALSINVMEHKKVISTMRSGRIFEIHTIGMDDTEIFLLGVKASRYMNGGK